MVGVSIPYAEITDLDGIDFSLSQIGYSSLPGNLKIWSVTVGGIG
jgi:hypothetical protein